MLLFGIVTSPRRRGSSRVGILRRATRRGAVIRLLSHTDVDNATEDNIRDIIIWRMKNTLIVQFAILIMSLWRAIRVGEMFYGCHYTRV